MKRPFGRLVKGQRGQGMTEYIIIVALIAIACIAAYSLFGEQIREVVKAISGGLGGQQSATTQQVTITPGKKGMSDFADGK